MNDLSHIQLNSRTVYDYLSKYGFNDGEGVLEEEKPLCEQEALKLAGMLKKHLVDWEPHVLMTGHNPYYVCFVNSSTGKYVTFYDMEEKQRRKIQKLLDTIRA